MSKTGAAIAAWFDVRAQPGERLVTWVLLGYAKPPDVAQHDPMAAHIARRGLVAQDQLHSQQQGFVAVTDRRVLFGSQGGVFGFKPKDLQFDEPVDTCRVEWFDQRRPVADERYLLFRFGDARWMRRSAMVHQRTNAELFVAELGDRAVPIET